jgi:hypothetical protein
LLHRGGCVRRDFFNDVFLEEGSEVQGDHSDLQNEKNPQQGGGNPKSWPNRHLRNGWLAHGGTQIQYPLPAKNQRRIREENGNLLSIL